MKKEKETKKKYNFGETFKYLKATYKYAKEERKYLILFFLCNLLLMGISVIAPILSAQKILKLTDNLWKQLIFVVIAIFLLEIFRNLMRNFYSFTVNKYFYAVRKNIQLALSEETLKITTDDLNTNSSGIFIERINNDTNNLTDIFTQLIDLLVSIVGNVGVFISIFFLNKIIFLLYFVFIIILFLLHKKAANINYEKNRINKKCREETSGFISELVRGAKDIKILNAEKSFLKRADVLIQKLGDSGYDYFRTRAKMRLINGNIRDVLDLLISLIGIYFIATNQLSVASMLIIVNYQNRILGISSDIEALLEIVKSYDLSASRIFGILEGNEFKKEHFGTKHVKKLEGDIEFKDVTFKYDDDNEVLKKMNFKIKANETVSFVGKSGAGKSTIFNLISALYFADEGNILLDNIDITELDKDSIRGNLSIISQNPYIYNMTIKENLQIIKSDATEEDIIEACKMACLHEFIMSLKDGYDTIVGEGGVTLSGGQRQRLAIARAFLLGTEIILFDEATSALDNETQNEIRKAIDNMKGEYTVLIIAHRLSTVINSDKIFVIDDGRVIDSGTHKELLKKSRTYKKLYDTELETEN